MDDQHRVARKKGVEKFWGNGHARFLDKVIRQCERVFGQHRIHELLPSFDGFVKDGPKGRVVSSQRLLGAMGQGLGNHSRPGFLHPKNQGGVGSVDSLDWICLLEKMHPPVALCIESNQSVGFELNAVGGSQNCPNFVQNECPKVVQP